MNPSTIPASCSLALTAVLAAGISHWWSVRHFTSLIENGVPIPPAVAPASPNTEGNPVSPALASKLAAENRLPEVLSGSGKQEKEFFSALVEKMNHVEAQNRDLLDQLAETNRDMMKLEFRVDSHSESFRPLPLIEDKPFSSIDQNPGVLPPRAEPVGLPSY